jgi:zinc transport system substrate-binding protein
MNKFKPVIYIFLILAAAAGFYLLALSGKQSQMKIPESGKIKIITTIFPLYDFVRNIGGDKVDVMLLLPPGIEPHTFEPKPRDVILISQSDIFLYTGIYMEAWVPGITKSLNNKRILISDAGANLNFIQTRSEGTDTNLDTVDPHVWLDFGNAEIMTENIAGLLSRADPVNRTYYQSNAGRYKSLLSGLDEKYRTELSLCQKRDIVYAGHYAFGYLARRYNLSYQAAQGVSPDAEPTAKDLSGLIRQVRENNIKYIYYEELTSPKIAEILAAETGTKLLMLNAAHNVSKEQINKGISYLDIMENNLQNLKTGLECR